MDPVTLRTDRLILRAFTLDDVDAVFEACQDPDIQFFTPAPSPYRREDAMTFVSETASNGWSEDKDYILGAFRLDTGEFIGQYCLTRVSEGVYELGYWAVKEQRGHGYSAEAAQAFLDWGWQTLDVHRMEWWAMVGNTASRALAEKLGFQLEGTLLRRGIMNGEPRDWWIGGLLRAEDPATPG